MADCLFCRIRDGAIPAKIVAETPEAIAFRDISPQAPTHILVIPRKHVASLDETSAADAPLLGALLLLAQRVAREAQLADGYRTVINTGAHGGQTVFHLHLHILGGRACTWPPG